MWDLSLQLCVESPPAASQNQFWRARKAALSSSAAITCSSGWFITNNIHLWNPRSAHFQKLQKNTNKLKKERKNLVLIDSNSCSLYLDCISELPSGMLRHKIIFYPSTCLVWFNKLSVEWKYMSLTVSSVLCFFWQGLTVAQACLELMNLSPHPCGCQVLVTRP